MPRFQVQSLTECDLKMHLRLSQPSRSILLAVDILHGGLVALRPMQATPPHFPILPGKLNTSLRLFPG